MPPIFDAVDVGICDVVGLGVSVGEDVGALVIVGTNVGTDVGVGVIVGADDGSGLDVGIDVGICIGTGGKVDMCMFLSSGIITCLKSLFSLLHLSLVRLSSLKRSNMLSRRSVLSFSISSSIPRFREVSENERALCLECVFCI